MIALWNTVYWLKTIDLFYCYTMLILYILWLAYSEVSQEVNVKIMIFKVNTLRKKSVLATLEQYILQLAEPF